jgi:hypothetical protein
MGYISKKSTSVAGPHTCMLSARGSAQYITIQKRVNDRVFVSSETTLCTILCSVLAGEPSAYLQKTYAGAQRFLRPQYSTP